MSSFIWWKIDEGELNKQVKNYETLKIFDSARGIVLLCTIFLFAINILLIKFYGEPPENIIDGFLLLILGIFSYYGYNAANILLMLFWTVEKFYLFFELIVERTQTLNDKDYIFQIIWWVIFMSPFYFSYAVEKRRRAIKTN